MTNENEKVVNGHRVKTGEPGENGTKSNERHILRQIHEKRKQDKLQLVKVNEAARALRSPADQMAVLDDRLGEGMGANKERLRLEIARAELSLKGLDGRKGSMDPSYLKRETAYLQDFIRRRKAELEKVKLENRGYREMRKFGLRPREHAYEEMPATALAQVA
ncbi:MAG: hypothetical protein KGI60_00035 [Patescibacteria group bacterium]|nr:hypothetical protein [Patescibacteria group bacterium]